MKLFPHGLFLPRIEFIFTKEQEREVLAREREEVREWVIHRQPCALYVQQDHLVLVSVLEATVRRGNSYRYNISALAHELVHYLQELVLGRSWMRKNKANRKVELWPCRVSCILCWLLLTKPTGYEKRLARWRKLLPW